MQSHFPSSKDQALIQIVDSALDDVARRSGQWLVCGPGCTQCCIGVFPINQLDAARLRRGLAALQTKAPERADRIRQRSREAVNERRRTEQVKPARQLHSVSPKAHSRGLLDADSKRSRDRNRTQRDGERCERREQIQRRNSRFAVQRKIDRARSENQQRRSQRQRRCDQHRAG